MSRIDWQKIRLVVFDVDGTLYDQRRLRARMIRDLALHCLGNPRNLRLLRQISRFRHCREELATEESTGIAELQYRRPAESLGIETEEMRRIVADWMLRRPLAHLRLCRYANLADFLTALRAKEKTVAVLSDYPAADKLEALGLEVDLAASAVDAQIDRLKPHPRGLEWLLEAAGVEPQQAVLIGDRDDRDGECARRAGVGYLIKSENPVSDGHHFRDYGDLVRSLHSNSAEEAALQ